MTGLTALALVGGLVLLVVGAELLVRGAAAIASRLGIEPVIIGLTVVAFGTSAPELAVSVGAAASGSSDVAFGNVVGSNIANILLILGASAVVGGVAVSRRIVSIDVPLLLAVSVVTMLLALDNEIGRVDGFILFVGVVAYTGWLIRDSRRESAAIKAEYQDSIEALEVPIVDRPLPVQVALLVVGLGALIGGSQLLVHAATTIASAFGVSQLVIGLTVVSVGTSLPELATSMTAALRGQRDIAVGNVIGSNLFNLMCVLGAAGVVAPASIPVSDASLRLDLPVMLAATFALAAIFWNGFQVRWWEGVVLLAFYALFIAYLVLEASDHDAAEVVRPVALIVTPLVVLTFGVLGVQGWRRQRLLDADATRRDGVTTP